MAISQEIEQILFAEIGSALQRVLEASDAVNLNIADMPVGMVVTDGPEQSRTVWQERTLALTEAIERLTLLRFAGTFQMICD